MRISTGYVGRKSFIAAGGQSGKKRSAEREDSTQLSRGRDVGRQKPWVC